MLSDEWLWRSNIFELQQAMIENQLTSRQLVLSLLERIARYNTRGPAVNAVLELNPDAVQIAEALDAERRVNGSRGVLHGIPILIKDNIDTADKMHTSAGSRALANSYAAADAHVAARLRDAGAVILGKTNMTEWANFMTDDMPNGYSSRGGQVLNPYGAGLDVGGSSSGSGVAVAAGMAIAAVGTETSGSILSPASQNGIVGIKPTVGLVSRTGIIPIAHSQDTAGPMAKTVADAACLLSALAGPDPRDPATLTSLGRRFEDYTQFLNLQGLNGARIGIPRDVFYDQLNDERADIMSRAIAVMAANGAVIVDPVVIPTCREKLGYQVLVYEFKADLNAYLQKLSSRVSVHSLADVIAFNQTHEAHMLRYGQTVLLESEATSGTLTEPDYILVRAKDLRCSQTDGIDSVMAEHELDALLFPSDFGCSIAAKAGYPSITVPGGFTSDGCPFGVTFTSLAFSEPTLIRLAYAFEQATGHRRAPNGFYES